MATRLVVSKFTSGAEQGTLPAEPVGDLDGAEDLLLKHLPADRSRLSCRRVVSCLLVLTRTRPTDAMKPLRPLWKRIREPGVSPPVSE